MTSRELVQRHREELLAAAERYGARNVRVVEESLETGRPCDIMFVVRFDPDRTALDLDGLYYEFEEIFGVEVDVADEDGLKGAHRTESLRTAVAL